jgi:tetratricopeptide (TPR) repeat protein
MNNLAGWYSNLGRQQEAIELREEVLKARKRTLGDEHPNTLVSINNLARWYSNLGRQQEAIKLGEEVLKARKRTLGEEHPDTLVSMNNLNFFLTNLHQQNNPQNLVLRPALQPTQKIKGNTRSRWSLRSWSKKRRE